MPNTQTVDIKHKDVTLKCQLVKPELANENLPGILVMHDAMGLSDFTVNKAKQLAEMGYLALATDMYGNGAHSENPEEAGKFFIDFHNTPELIRDRVLALYRHLKAQPEVDANNIAAIGFCFGGQCVLELARSGEDVNAVVSYHGLLTTPSPAEVNSLRTTVAVYTGSKDPYAPREHVDAIREEMTASGAELLLTEFSGAYHAFTNPNPPRGVESGMKYDELCDRVSWAGTCALLQHALKRE